MRSSAKESALESEKDKTYAAETSAGQRRNEAMVSAAGPGIKRLAACHVAADVRFSRFLSTQKNLCRVARHARNPYSEFADFQNHARAARHSPARPQRAAD